MKIYLDHDSYTVLKMAGGDVVLRWVIHQVDWHWRIWITPIWQLCPLQHTYQYGCRVTQCESWIGNILTHDPMLRKREVAIVAKWLYHHTLVPFVVRDPFLYPFFILVDIPIYATIPTVAVFGDRHMFSIRSLFPRLHSYITYRAVLNSSCLGK